MPQDPPAPARRTPDAAERTALLAALLAVLLGALVLGGAPSASAEDPGRPGSPHDPVRLVIATAALAWEDVDPATTPHLQCLADRSGVGAMNTTSTSVVSTKRQGLETLRSGYRGLAAQAPRTSGIPTPASDQWERLGVPSTTVDLSAPDADPGAGPAAVADALADGDLVEVIAPSLPRADDPSHDEALAALDAVVGAVLEELGGCAGADLPRTLLVSVAATDPEHPEAVEQPGAVASRTAGLQVALDTAFPGQALTTGATKQPGVVVLTDVLPTILASHGATAEGLIPGQPFRGVDHPHPQQLALDRSEAARLVDAATVPALGSWFALGALGLVILLVPPLAARPRLAALGRALAAIAPLPVAVGLFASLVPWWRAEHPTLALTGVLWAGCATLSVIVLAGPWRRHRLGPPGVSAALIALLILAESATGSRLQLASPLGAQPISGGRFYGLSNHLFGLVLAAALMALLCLFAVVRAPRARAAWTVAVGGVVAVVCVAPSMGADFGSMLATIPAFGLLALLVSGIRPRPWHLLALGAGGAAAVLGVSFLDWLRPPEQRTHLGRFVDELLSGNLASVVLRKLAQNMAMTTGYPVLAVLMVLAVLAAVVLLMPRRLHRRRLTALDAEHPASYAVRVALVVGAGLGYAVNDTGPVLVAAMVGVWLCLLPPVLPAPPEAEEIARATL